MKRKGFTLVELLIIVAIIGALAATMMVSSGSSIAKAKATAIANNLRVCTSGAQLFYLKHADDEGADDAGINVTCQEMLAEAVPNFTDFTGSTITYAASDATGDGAKAPDKWLITVALTGADKEEVLTQLKAIKGFNAVSKDKDVVYTVFTGVAKAKAD